MQAHTYSLNDTEKSCAVTSAYDYHKTTLWSVQIKIQNQFALVHIKYCRQLLKVLQDLFKMSFIEMKKFFHYNYSMLIKTKCFPFH